MADWTKIETYQRGAAYLYLRQRLNHGRVHPRLKLPTSAELLAEAFAAAGMKAPR